MLVPGVGQRRARLHISGNIMRTAMGGEPVLLAPSAAREFNGAAVEWHVLPHGSERDVDYR